MLQLVLHCQLEHCNLLEERRPSFISSECFVDRGSKLIGMQLPGHTVLTDYQKGRQKEVARKAQSAAALVAIEVYFVSSNFSKKWLKQLSTHSHPPKNKHFPHIHYSHNLLTNQSI